MKAYIKHISHYLPEMIVTNEDIAREFPEWTAEKVASKVGVEERHIAADGETALDMAEKAARKLFEEHNINKECVDFVLLCTQSPDYYLPTSACILHDRLALSTKCGALDFNLGCSGYVYGLSLAKGLIIGGISKNVLLITSETYSKHLHPKDKGNRTIFGDAATASLISTEEGIGEICEFSLGTDGKGAENLIVKTGAMRMPELMNDLRMEEGNPVSSDYLYMNGGEIFNFTSNAVPVLVGDVLKNNDLTDGDISLYVFHQANKYMINYLRKLLDIDKDRFYIYLKNVGNTVSSTIPIALYNAHKEDELKGNVLLAGFGVGYSWAGVILNVK